MENKPLRIVFWNANGVRHKQTELTYFLQNYKVDVLLLNETQLKPCHKLVLQNYNTYRTDRLTTPGGGTAVLVKKHLKSYELPNTPSPDLETTGIVLKTGQTQLALIAAYLSPSRTLNKTDLITTLNTNMPTILAGDLNAKHTDWNSKKNNTRGQKLRQIAQDENLRIIAPDEPTHAHLPTNTTDVLDIALLKNVTQNWTIETKIDLSSDHFPVFLELEITTPSHLEQIRFTNWESYTNSLPTLHGTLTTPEDIEAAVLDLQDKILTTMDQCTKTITRNEYKPLPRQLRNLIRDKNHAKKTYVKTLHPTDKTKLNRLTEEVKTRLEDYRNERWRAHLGTLSTQDQSLWKMTNILTNKRQKRQFPPVKYGPKTAFTDEDKAELFADMLEKQFRPGPDTGTNLDNFLTHNNENPKPTTKDEIHQLISTLANRKAPGRDNITNEALKHLPPHTHERLADITNAIMRTRHYPTVWKTARTVMILKQKKPRTQTDSYRPISLLPTISKIVERILLDRLHDALETQRALPPHQFGFRHDHNTLHPLIILTEDITQQFNLSNSTAAVFLDLEKAFDKVWHRGLIYKMAHLNLPLWIIQTTESYLRHRSFQVQINRNSSTIRTAEAGVPQGSVLGPTLFNIYVHDLPTPRLCKILQYADDTILYTHSRNIKITTPILERCTTDIINYFTKWRIVTNTTKTEAVLFNKKRNRDPPPLKIHDKTITWKKETKYLGVWLDKRLTFNKHLTETRQKVRGISARLYPLLCKYSGLNRENKLALIKTIVIPTALYASELYVTQGRPYKVDTIQSSINRTIRHALDAPYYITNEQIRDETHIETLRELTNRRTKNLVTKMDQHTNTTVQQLTQRQIRHRSTDTHTGPYQAIK